MYGTRVARQRFMDLPPKLWFVLKSVPQSGGVDALRPESNMPAMSLRLQSTPHSLNMSVTDLKASHACQSMSSGWWPLSNLAYASSISFSDDQYGTLGFFGSKAGVTQPPIAGRPLPLFS